MREWLSKMDQGLTAKEVEVDRHLGGDRRVTEACDLMSSKDPQWICPASIQASIWGDFP